MELTIEMIDAQLADGFYSLRFQPIIEELFEAEEWRLRTAQLIRSGLLGVLIFDLYLAVDWLLLPDVFITAVVYRIAIFTPLVGLAVYLAYRSDSILFREGVTAAMVVCAVGVPLLLFLRSTSPIRGDYHYGIVLIMIYAAVIQRLRFRYALAQTIVCTMMACWAIIEADVLDATFRMACISFHVTAAALLLSASYTLERALRRGYLFSARARLLKERLERGARLDHLTGLWNRRHLNDVMDTAWRDCPASGLPMSVILVDIDRFKLFNDSNGHLAGDDCLTRFSRCLAEAVGGGPAQAVRFGGEEFVVFGPGVDRAGAQATADRLADAVRREAIAHPALGPGALVTASCGIAVGWAPATSAASLLAAADTALYQAKADGRACIRVAGAGPDTAGLRAALDDMRGGRPAARAVA